MDLTIGVLSFHGDVLEHIQATMRAAEKLHTPVTVIPVRTKEALSKVAGLILPGGESTTMHKLCVREGMWEQMKSIPFIFGTCAGAIMLAKKILHKAEGQESLERIGIDIDRNAYGRQTDSFQEILSTTLGEVTAVYIRAPKIVSIKPSITIFAGTNENVLACEEISDGLYNLATCFHPELTTTLFHEYFLKKIINS